MKTIFILLLFFCNSLQAQYASSNSTSGNQIQYFKSGLNDLLDETGNIIIENNGSDSVIFAGENTSNNFGTSVSTAGDVNGDGYSDIIVGASGYNSNTGRAYIFFGGIVIDNIADVTLAGESSNSFFGYAVSSAGDVNGDGYSDVIVGANCFSSNTGRTYIYLGGISMNNIADVVMTGEAGNNIFGSSVSIAGDVNNDGYSDVVVGASGYSGNRGRSYIFLGGTSMDNNADIILTGENVNDWFGQSVSFAGDVNGDGYTDVIIGAHSYFSYSYIGRAYIFYGGISMNNTADVIMTGETAGDNFGISVSSANDVNGDGYSDVVVGATSNLLNGSAYIFFGGASMNNTADVKVSGVGTFQRFGYSVSSGDVNADGYSDILIGAYGNSTNIKGKVFIFFGGNIMNNSPDITLSGGIAEDYFGYSVCNAGDVNGDSYLDVIVGAVVYNSFMGKAYLYYNMVPKPELSNPSNNSSDIPLIINFKWKKFNPAVYYILNVSTDSSFNNIVVNDTVYFDTVKIISGFQKGSIYYWRVRAKDTSGIIYTSSVWNFTTIPPIYLNLKVLMEGMYYQFFNQMIRKDTVKVYLRNATSPYAVVDSAKGIIDSLSFSNIFSFINAPSGTYYIVAKHFNSIETWSKAGGESMTTNGSIYSYDFTTSASKAYGNNQKLKGSKYCIFGGNVNGDAIVDASDLSDVDNDSYAGLSGRYLRSDVNGDGFVDASDITIVDNNRAVVISRPYF